MSRTARLIIPALRWTTARGFDDERATIDHALDIGVGGFCIFGGEAHEVARLTSELRARSRLPLLIASDLERGAGQQFAGATPLPPLAALGSLDELETTRRAGRLTAREALAVGVNWLYAPVADIDAEPENPIIGSRAFGSDAGRVAAHVAAWIDGAQSEGVLCCAKHFPGHGRTTEDSHAVLPRVTAGREALEQDLEPFRAAVAAGVGSIMTAHVMYDALDASTAATLSPGIVRGLLRDELGFEGLVVTDGIGMEGLRRAVTEGEETAAVAAVNAGCDALLYPTDLRALAAALEAGEGGALDASRVVDAAARITAACATVRSRGTGVVGRPEDRAWAESLADRTCRVVRGRPRVAEAVRLLAIDDDAGSGHSHRARGEFARTLSSHGVDVRTVEAAVPANNGDARPLVIAIHSDVRAFRSRANLSAGAAQRLGSALDAEPDATIVVFGHAPLCESIPGRNVLLAWGGEPLMQRAAARRITSGN